MTVVPILTFAVMLKLSQYGIGETTDMSGFKQRTMKQTRA